MTSLRFEVASPCGARRRARRDGRVSSRADRGAARARRRARRHRRRPPRRPWRRPTRISSARRPRTIPTSETVTIKLVADPARKARVSWGRKDLGFAPLEIQRPRGSGPLDLVVVAPGALTLHTRVYTDRDDKLALRLYAESEAPNMLGYRAPVEDSTKSGAAADPAKRKRPPRQP